MPRARKRVERRPGMYSDKEVLEKIRALVGTLDDPRTRGREKTRAIRELGREIQLGIAGLSAEDLMRIQGPLQALSRKPDLLMPGEHKRLFRIVSKTNLFLLLYNSVDKAFRESGFEPLRKSVQSFEKSKLLGRREKEKLLEKARRLLEIKARKEVRDIAEREGFEAIIGLSKLKQAVEKMSELEGVEGHIVMSINNAIQSKEREIIDSAVKSERRIPALRALERSLGGLDERIERERGLSESARKSIEEIRREMLNEVRRRLGYKA